MWRSLHIDGLWQYTAGPNSHHILRTLKRLQKTLSRIKDNESCSVFEHTILPKTPSEVVVRLTDLIDIQRAASVRYTSARCLTLVAQIEGLTLADQDLREAGEHALNLMLQTQGDVKIAASEPVTMELLLFVSHVLLRFTPALILDGFPQQPAKLVEWASSIAMQNIPDSSAIACLRIITTVSATYLHGPPVANPKLVLLPIRKLMTPSSIYTTTKQVCRESFVKFIQNTVHNIINEDDLQVCREIFDLILRDLGMMVTRFARTRYSLVTQSHHQKLRDSLGTLTDIYASNHELLDSMLRLRYVKVFRYAESIIKIPLRWRFKNIYCGAWELLSLLARKERADVGQQIIESNLVVHSLSILRQTMQQSKLSFLRTPITMFLVALLMWKSSMHHTIFAKQMLLHQGIGISIHGLQQLQSRNEVFVQFALKMMSVFQNEQNQLSNQQLIMIQNSTFQDFASAVQFGSEEQQFAVSNYSDEDMQAIGLPFGCNRLRIKQLLEFLLHTLGIFSHNIHHSRFFPVPYTVTWQSVASDKASSILANTFVYWSTINPRLFRKAINNVSVAQILSDLVSTTHESLVWVVFLLKTLFPLKFLKLRNCFVEKIATEAQQKDELYSSTQKIVRRCCKKSSNCAPDSFRIRTFWMLVLLMFSEEICDTLHNFLRNKTQVDSCLKELCFSTLLYALMPDKPETCSLIPSANCLVMLAGFTSVVRDPSYFGTVIEYAIPLMKVTYQMMNLEAVRKEKLDAVIDGERQRLADAQIDLDHSIKCVRYHIELQYPHWVPSILAATVQQSYDMIVSSVGLWELDKGHFQQYHPLCQHLVNQSVMEFLLCVFVIGVPSSSSTTLIPLPQDLGVLIGTEWCRIACESDIG